MSTHLRGFLATDAAVLGALRADEATHVALLGRARPTNAAEKEAWLNRRLGEPDALFLVVADEGDAPIGFVQVVAVDEQARHGMFGIALVPAARGRGVGRAAIDALFDRLALEGRIDKLVLHVAADHRQARGLYAAAGFREVGTLVRHYREDAGRWHDVVVMERFVAT